ncbi:Uncharacterised protein [Vibrio cholerae]|nr:Uncharacterised protein [Vibrio cholerae]
MAYSTFTQKKNDQLKCSLVSLSTSHVTTNKNMRFLRS